jgi:hypothetical protein
MTGTMTLESDHTETGILVFHLHDGTLSQQCSTTGTAAAPPVIPAIVAGIRASQELVLAPAAVSGRVLPSL